jgi:predicted PurR-regulated permease PerM
MDKEREPFLSNPFVARAARWGLLVWSVIGLLILVYLVYRYVFHPIRIVFPPLVVALIVVYLLNPIVSMLQARGLHRVWATLIVYLVFLSMVGLAIAYLTDVIGHQVTQFVRTIPALLDKAQSGLTALFDRLGIHVDTKALLAAFEPKKGSAFNFLGRLTSFTSGVVHVAFVLVLGPLIAFYLLVDLPKIKRGAEALVPAARRDEVTTLAERVGDTLGGFFRGQLVVALMVGLASMFGYWLVGLPYFALLGALTGLFALVPLIGTLIAAVPVLFVALTAGKGNGQMMHIPGGWRLALACVVVLVLVQELDTRVLSPLLKGRAMRLHPVTVMLSLLVGGSLLGLWGMLLAVPVVAGLKVVVLHVWDTRSQWPPRAEVAPAPRPVAEAKVADLREAPDGSSERELEQAPAEEVSERRRRRLSG